MEKFGNRLYWFVILFKYTLKLEVRYNLLLILLLGARRHKPPPEHPQIEAIRKNKTKTWNQRNNKIRQPINAQLLEREGPNNNSLITLSIIDQ